MAEKIRIYQLAKDLNLETKELLPILDEMGVEYKSHSSTLEADTADTIRQLIEDEGGAPEAEAAVEAADAAEERAAGAAPTGGGSSAGAAVAERNA